jgi:3-isopropylmalate/(R)-2-methylmalate dehydratase large subunit
MPAQPAPQTLAQKLIARASGREDVAVGEIVTCKVDLAMFHDSSGPRRLKPMLEELGAQIWDKLARGAGDGPLRARARRRLAPHRAHRARLGARAAAAARVRQPSASATWWCRSTATSAPACSAWAAIRTRPLAARFGAYMFGIGSTEMLGVVVTGEIWVRVPDASACGGTARWRRA